MTVMAAAQSVTERSQQRCAEVREMIKSKGMQSVVMVGAYQKLKVHFSTRDELLTLAGLILEENESY